MTKINIKDASGSEVVAILIGVLLAGLVVFAFQAWIVMLVIGALHGSVSSSVPALGYWASALVTFALGLVASFFRK